MMQTLTEAVLMVSGTIKHTRLDRQSIPKNNDKSFNLNFTEIEYLIHNGNENVQKQNVK